MLLRHAHAIISRNFESSLTILQSVSPNNLEGLRLSGVLKLGERGSIDAAVESGQSA